jgi:hypothetical protein
MIKKILLYGIAVIVLIITIFCVVVAMQPAHYTVQRSASINAPASIVFAHVNDFHKWDAWSPWAKLDPNMKTSFEGAPAGAGAVYGWTGNSDVGEGRMTITDSKPSESIKIKLEFIKPFTQTALTNFDFKPQGNQTAVTWTMDGENNFVGKAFCLFINMDKMVGADFEKGLAQMKTISEKAAQ